MGEGRSYRIDALKGIAIIAVVLYHFGGYLTYGYLGVDIFFVISGYLMMKGIIRGMKNDSFIYWKFLIGRVSRLWLPVLLMAALALVVGYFTMLPDDFENLSESVIATNVFANNVLACITTKNYWDVVNVFKPLMHTWYLGVLMQAYIVLPLIYCAVFKISKGSIRAVTVSVWLITLVSLLAYLAPIATPAQKFYYLPFRTFELTAGSLISCAPQRVMPKGRTYHMVEAGSLTVVLAMLCINSDMLTSTVKLMATVFATAILLILFSNSTETVTQPVKALAIVGKASFSIYLCHQVIVAYMYYMMTDRNDVCILMIFTAFVVIFSAAFYNIVEKPLNYMARNYTAYILILAIGFFLITSILSGIIYLNAGVIRDVPELGIEKTNVHRGMHAEYCDIPYSWDREFSDSEKVKIVVIGDSFGRDWANILNESSISEEIEISYIFPYSKAFVESHEERLMDADIVFRTFSSSITDIADELPTTVPYEKLYIVGYKNFGSSNGIIYSHRGEPDYYDQYITLDTDVLVNNSILREQYGEHYIDMIRAVQNESGSVRVFTDDQHFISQDCRHLTKYGAQYYSRIIDLSWIVDMPQCEK